MSQLVATSPSWINKPICVKPDPRFDQSHEPFILEANCLDYLAIVPTWWTGRTDEAIDEISYARLQCRKFLFFTARKGY